MSAPAMEATTTRTGRSLVAPGLFERLTGYLVLKNAMEPQHAARVMDQALAYLATCARKGPGAPALYMSHEADFGWHAFMLYTQQYDAFFASHGWPKVHHGPCDGFGGATYPSHETALPLTMRAIEEAGYHVDRELWQARADCGDTCGDDGGGGNPLPTCEHSVQRQDPTGGDGPRPWTGTGRRRRRGETRA